MSNFVHLCECEGVASATHRINDVIADVSVSRRYDLFPYLGYPTVTTVDFEAGYLDLCSKMMDHIQCPSAHRCMKGNYIPGNFSTWIGFCLCNYQTSCQSLEQSYLTSTLPHLVQSEFPPSHPQPSSSSSSSQDRVSTSDPHVDFSFRIANNIFNAIMKPNYQHLLVQSSTSPAVWDLCASFYNVCSSFLQKIACPADLQHPNVCSQEYNSSSPHDDSKTGEYLYPYGKIQNGTSYCGCGGMDMLDLELVITGLLSEIVNEEYTYIPSPVAPYSLAISSDPAKQLIQTKHIPPL